MEKFEFIFEREEKSRIDKFLSEEFVKVKPEVTRSKVQFLIEEGLVYDENNQKFKSSSAKINSGQKIIVELPKARESKIEAKKIDFGIVFEDDDLLVINKPAGLTVHPGSGNQSDTLVNALLHSHKGQLSTISGEERPGIVHRLDKDTSGLMLVAKNDFTHQALSQNLQDRQVKRSYLAFIYGVMDPKDGKIDKNIIRNRFNRLKMTVSKNSGRNALTNYQTKEVFWDGFLSLVECKLETGRTHQIRIHFESEKHSLVGDQTYNSCKKTAPSDLNDEAKEFIANFSRQALHSYKIGFTHPRNKKEMEFEINLPKDLQDLYELV